MNNEKNFFFDNYMIEEENKFAGETVFHTITNIGKLYNPLFVTSESGNGKTTLVKAAVKWAEKHNYLVKTVYAEEVKDMICEAIYARLDCNSVVCEKMGDADVIVIENLEALLDKPSTLKEVFDVIGYFVAGGKQVFVTSELPMKQYAIQYEGTDSLEVSIPKLDSEFKFKLVRRLETKYDLHLDILQTSIVMAKSRSIEDLEFVFKQITEMAKLVKISKEEATKIVLTEYL